MSQSHHLDRFTSTDFTRYSYCTERRFTLYDSRALVYSTTLRLPGEYLDDRLRDSADPSNYVGKLKSIMHHLKAIPPRPAINKQTYMSKDLLNCTHVFVQHDAVCN